VNGLLGARTHVIISAMRQLSHPCRALATFILAGILAPSAHAQQSTPADLGPKVDAIFARFTDKTPGCAVGVGKNGQTVYTHGYGMANLEYNVPITESTVLESGSVAKQFTASALVLLAQDGKLSLDDDIRKYLPEVPSFGGQKITIRNLLTHTSGLRDQWGLLGIEGRGPGSQVHSPATTLDLVVHQKMLNFPPGSQYLYSNTGYALAGIIVERVSGKTLDAFTQERLFRPLGMTHTRWRDDFTAVVPNRATAYSGSPANGFHTDMPFTNMIGNGGLLSTMADLLEWNENLDHPTVGGQPYVDALQTRMRLTTGRTITYALGLEVTDYQGVREVSHGGSTAGYRTYLARYPEQHVSVAVWCNYAGANPASLAHQVVDLVLAKSAAAATQAFAEKVEVSAAAQQQWAGVYRDPQTDEVITFVANGGGLTAGTGRGQPAILIPRGGARFHANAGDVEFTQTSGRRGFVLVRPSGDSAHFEEARPPAQIRVQDYAGTYASDELDVKLVIAAKGDKLVLRRRPADEIELRPAYADDFAAPGLGSIRFARDASGRVTGFAIFAGRVIDVRFTRVAR
jgi:CubicO group peptidase (beta-lactamase class C family)